MLTRGPRVVEKEREGVRAWARADQGGTGPRESWDECGGRAGPSTGKREGGPRAGKGGELGRGAWAGAGRGIGELGWADFWVAGFSWAGQVGPSAGFGLGFQSGLGWDLLGFWVGWVSSFSFHFSF